MIMIWTIWLRLISFRGHALAEKLVFRIDVAGERVTMLLLLVCHTRTSFLMTNLCTVHHLGGVKLIFYLWKLILCALREADINHSARMNCTASEKYHRCEVRVYTTSSKNLNALKPTEHPHRPGEKCV